MHFEPKEGGDDAVESSTVHFSYLGDDVLAGLDFLSARNDYNWTCITTFRFYYSSIENNSGKSPNMILKPHYIDWWWVFSYSL